MTCSNCHHWDREGRRYAYSYDDETYEDIEAPHRICKRIVLVSELVRQGAPPTDPFTVDASLHRADLFTPGNFSCSLWKPLTP